MYTSYPAARPAFALGKFCDSPSMWFFLVSTVFTVTDQHIHSLRASGVMSSHAVSALGEVVRAFRKSAGNLCAVPPEILWAIDLYYHLGDATCS